MYHEYRQRHADLVKKFGPWPGPEDLDQAAHEAERWYEVKLLLLHYMSEWLRLKEGNQVKLEARLRLKVGEDWYRAVHVEAVCKLLDGIPR
jgi:hypothetical protein